MVSNRALYEQQFQIRKYHQTRLKCALLRTMNLDLELLLYEVEKRDTVPEIGYLRPGVL